jgi:hypothetical protein
VFFEAGTYLCNIIDTRKVKNLFNFLLIFQSVVRPAETGAPMVAGGLSG